MRLLLVLAVMVVLPCSAWGEVQGGCLGGTGMVCSEKAFLGSDLQGYVIPSDPASPGRQNQLWVLDIWGKRSLDLSLPAGKEALLEIVPSLSGYLSLFHRHPSGELQVQYLGYITTGRKYLTWICSAEVGTHEIWYRTAWQESNTARVHVSGVRREGP
jgi:hypothetical protein